MTSTVPVWAPDITQIFECEHCNAPMALDYCGSCYFECDKCGQVHTSDELRIRIDGMSGWDDFLCVKCFEEDELQL